MPELSTLRKFEGLSPFEIKDELSKPCQELQQENAVGLP